MNSLYVVIGSLKGSENEFDSFICDMYDDQQTGTLEQAKDLKESLDKAYGKDYDYRVAKLCFLD